MARGTALVASVAALLLPAGCGRGPTEAPLAPDWTTPPPGVSAALQARVTFDAMRVAVENRDPGNWTDVLIEVRRPPSPRVFRYRAEVIVGGRTLPMGALHFAADDGRRLSPFEGAPSEWRVQATLPDGSRGWATGRIVEVAPP